MRISDWSSDVCSSDLIAVLVEASIDKNRLRVGRIVAAVDCGAQVNPDIARQQIEGGLVFGLASAMGGSASYKRGLPATMRLGELGLPLLADIGDVTVEFIRSSEEPGGDRKRTRLNSSH